MESGRESAASRPHSESAPAVAVTRRMEVIAHLRHMADTPCGLPYRAWLFDAALMLDRDATLIWVDKRPARSSSMPTLPPDMAPPPPFPPPPFGEDLDD